MDCKIIFEFSEKQQKKLNKWKKDIKKKERPTDLMEYRFTPTGIGICCVVKWGKYKIDLTDVSTW